MRKGRSCDSLQAKNERIIKSRGQQLLNKDFLIEQLEGKNSALDSLIRNSRESQEIQGLQFQKDLQTERKKTKMWRRIGIIQAAVIVVIILIPNG